MLSKKWRPSYLSLNVLKQVEIHPTFYFTDAQVLKQITQYIVTRLQHQQLQ